ncbi:NCA2-domain-containing protein [Suillus clintonianus]|uniref:NCA2-domain-containing protein n=1 Tax=Suillus clintonianus TaxID=1904413 RepID=UPI001B85D9E5|nr:NCA2-domain-containing protein [Suillus clintonianus]KAG2129158.1 NCA2-domain-containing protein [Suillus clintonianus]
MTSTFAVHYTERLVPLTRLHLSTQTKPTSDGAELELTHAMLQGSPSEETVLESMDFLRYFVARKGNPGLQSDSEELLLYNAVVRKTIFNMYALAVDLYLQESSAAQLDAEWWADIEQSTWSVASYLLQSSPSRLCRVLQLIQTRNMSIRWSAFRPSSIARFYWDAAPIRLNPFTIALFPYLRDQSSAVASVSPVTAGRSTRPYSLVPLTVQIRDGVMYSIQRVVSLLLFPLRLAREECQLRRKELEKVRDERAEVLGKLLELRPLLANGLEADFNLSITGSSIDNEALTAFLFKFAIVTSGNVSEKVGLPLIQQLLFAFEDHRIMHDEYLEAHDLRRPSRLTLLWPRLFLLPPLTLYCAKYLYASRATLADLMLDVLNTVQNFFKGWLFDPIKDVLITIRAGGEDGVIVRREAVAADLDSLERMTLDLAREKLSYDSTQLEALSQRIRQGDLTAVLKIYEEDIKNPVKSAISGTLLRSMFIQVQKAKVDLDQALAGIDKLLKSQELTFAFVGVAPALAVIYVAGGFLGGLLSIRPGRYGGKLKKTSVWLAMRRIERLLLFQPKLAHHHHNTENVHSDTIPALTTGLLVLSLAHLREYALTSLPARSRLREGFLEDIEDLEDPGLRRSEKLRIIDRMWKSWGKELGWYDLAGGRSNS